MGPEDPAGATKSHSLVLAHHAPTTGQRNRCKPGSASGDPTWLLAPFKAAASDWSAHMHDIDTKVMMYRIAQMYDLMAERADEQEAEG